MKHSFKQNNSLKSHKKLCRTILIGIVSFLVLTFLEVFLLSAVSLIPRSAIRKHTQESAEYLLEKPVFYRVVKQDPASNIDHYADAILLNILYHFDSAHPVTSPLTASYYYTETHNENENLYTAVTSNVTPTYDYFRYWHGSIIYKFFYISMVVFPHKYVIIHDEIRQSASVFPLFSINIVSCNPADIPCIFEIFRRQHIPLAP